MRFLIVGSCVSRDVFTHIGQRGHSLLHYAARQSLVSALSHGRSELVDATRVESAFQRRCLENDFKGTTLEYVKDLAADVDCLIWDLIDERRGLLELSDGTIVTNNWELVGSGLIEDLPIKREIAFGSEEHFELWVRAVDVFIDVLRQTGLMQKTVCLAVPFAETSMEGEPLRGDGIHSPTVLTSLYRRYYEHIERFGVSMVRFVKDQPKTSVSHRWGPAAYHYTEQTEISVARQVLAFASRSMWNSEERGLFQEAFNCYASTSFPANEFVHVQGAVESLMPVPGLAKFEAGCDRLTVLFNGAVDPARASGNPVFQRSSWAADISGSKLYLSDPTMTLFPDLRIAWAQGKAGVSAVPGLCGALEGFMSSTGLSDAGGEIRLFGSSAGGFQALSVATFMPRATAIVNNPQLDWLRYEVRSAVRAVLDSSYRGEDQAGFRERHASAVSLLALWSEIGYLPAVKYLLNVASSTDVELQFKFFADTVVKRPDKFLGTEFELHAYTDRVAGHNPLGKDATLQFLETGVLLR